MSDPTTAVREHLVRVLDWGEAHVTFDKAVDGITPDRQGARTDGFEHTLWQLVEHIRIAQEDILDFSRNPKYREKKFPEDYWPTEDAPPSHEAWDASVKQFRSDLHEMQTLIADTARDLFATIPHGTGQTLLREALLVADHNAYHLGQLMFLRKMLEA